MNSLKYKLHLIQWWIGASIYKLLLSSNLSKKVQEVAIARLLKNAKAHVPYFKQVIQHLEDNNNYFDCLKEIPILTKTIVREQGRNIYSDIVDDKWKYWHNTGGSTGTPLQFPLGGHKSILGDSEMLHQMLLFLAMGYKLGDHICAIDGRRVSDEDLKKGICWGFNDNSFPYGLEHFSTVYLNDDTALLYLNKLNEVKPDFIRGYPSGVKSICEYINKFKYNLDFKLKAVYLTSENISNETKLFIEGVLGCPVWGQYGHSEMSVFAIKSPDNDYYECSPLYGLTEILDEHNRQVKLGEEGEIVVTGLNNYALPFIRYKTGDLAVYGGTRENGTVILSKLLGRSTDYLVDSNGEKKYLVGLIFGGHLRAFNYMKQWQIEQYVKGEVNIKIVKAQGFDNLLEQEVFEFFKSNKFKPNIVYLDEIAKTSRGKQKFLIQHIDL